MSKNMFKLFIFTLSCCLALMNCHDRIENEEEDNSGQQELPEQPAEEPEEPGTSTRTFTLSPGTDGRLAIRNDKNAPYEPGDIIYLQGKFEHISITDIKGSAERPIIITNYPGEPVVIGNPAWSKGSFAQGVHVINSQHIVLGGESRTSDFIIDGSVVEGARSSYFNLNLRKFTDNVEIKNMTILNGGMGIMAKTDPEIDQPETWHPNSQLNNLSIHDVIIKGVSEEAMYIGHTAVLWSWDENGKGYSTTMADRNLAHKTVRPIMWENVKIYDNYLEDIGNDGIQASAINHLEIYNNEINRWGLNKILYHSAGIIAGGYATYTNVHDNYVHDGWGEMFQFFGAGNSPHKVHNNLFVNSTSTGIAIYDEGEVEISNNTVVNCQGFSLKVNARKAKARTTTVNANVFIGSRIGKDNSRLTDIYINTEGGAIIKESGNFRFNSIKEARVDSAYFYQPVSGSSIGKAGYKKE